MSVSEPSTFGSIYWTIVVRANTLVKARLLTERLCDAIGTGCTVYDCTRYEYNSKFYVLMLESPIGLADTASAAFHALQVVYRLGNPWTVNGPRQLPRSGDWLFEGDLVEHRKIHTSGLVGAHFDVRNVRDAIVWRMPNVIADD